MNVAEKVIGLKGTVVNFRIGNKNPRFRQLILKFENLPEGIKPDNLIGRQVEVKWKNKTFKGRIYKKHGKKYVRAIFDKGLPGNILGESEVTIIK
ncbi:MAG: 50S ribosomal protein L35ae [Candidatus Njordarchaeia archaeon]